MVVEKKPVKKPVKRSPKTPPGVAPPFRPWEYARVVIAVSQDPVLLLNEYGREGWEAVNIDQYHGIAWMKRQS